MAVRNNIAMNKLLEKQINKYLPQEIRQDKNVMCFIDAVNNSYNVYEKDQALSKQAFNISEQEYTSINLNLEQQIVKRKRIEKELKRSEHSFAAAANRLSHLIANLHNGIMVEDENGDIVLVNQLFCDMFKLNMSPCTLTGVNGINVIKKSCNYFINPETNVQRLIDIVENRVLVIGEEIETIDGKIFLRDYVPIFVDNIYKGHLWKYEDITEKTINQTQLKRLSLVASANENGVLFTNPDGTIFWSNEGFNKITGYTNNEIIGATLLDLCRGTLSDKQVITEMLEAFGTGKTFNVEIIHYRKDKSWFWGRVKGQAILNEQQEVVQYFAMLEDITYERNREEQFHLLSLIAEENINAVVIADAQGRIEWSNDSFSKMSGYSKEEILGKVAEEVLVGEDTDKEVIRSVHDKIDTGEAVNCEILNYSKEGRKYWVALQLQAIKNSRGEVIKYFALLEDITDKKIEKEKLRESQMMWQFALEGAGDGVWEYNLKTNESFFSKQYKKMLGYDEEEFTNNINEWLSRIHPDDKDIIDKTNADYLKGGVSTHRCEYRMMHKQGNYVWVLERGVVMNYDEDGKPLKIVGTHKNITERKNAEQALKFNEEKYRNIIANMNLGLVELDINENIQFANHSFCDMCGYSLEELAGKRTSDILTQWSNHSLHGEKANKMKSAIGEAYEIPIKNKRGEVKWWLVSEAPRYTDNGELTGTIGIYLDITMEKQLQLDLIEARELAEESSRSKESFLANMSHEIRTPMNAIIGMSRQLQKTTLNEKQHFFLDTISSAAENLLVVINDILDISKVEAGRLTLEEIGFRMKDVVYRVMQVMSHKAEEKGLDFSCAFDETIFDILVGDPHRLNQVLLNIISNSIKFTEKGSVQIDCRVKDAIGNKQVISVTISDTGIGMDEWFLENLFQPFAQEDKTTARKYGGTGLGMAISRQLVELMGGEINVESKKNEGTVTTIFIPFTMGAETYLPKKEQGLYDSSILKDKKILLVEDNEMNRLVATTVLNNYGVIITEVQNGAEAISSISEFEYDLVLMDMQMPVMDGLEATAVIRKEYSQSLPIIALTANAIKGESDKCINAGMNDYISKPFEEEDLIKMIALWLSQKNKPVKKVATINNEKLFDLSTLKEISRGNEGFVQKMISLFVEQVPVSVKEIEEAYNIGDFTKIKSVAHRLKPGIDNMGISSLKNEIREIELLATSNQKGPAIEKLINHLAVVISEVVNQVQLL